MLCVAWAAFGDWRFGLPTHDKTTVINTVVAVGAFILVAWGVVVALAAYVSATGTPDLSVEITVEYMPSNKLVFQGAVQQQSELRENARDHQRSFVVHGQTKCEVIITNVSKYSARNPGVRIAIFGLGGVPPQEGWTIISPRRPYGPHEIQWDGGTDYIIHGQWSRTLPNLEMGGVFTQPPWDPAFRVDVAADGFGPISKVMKIRFLEEAAFKDYALSSLGQLGEEGADYYFIPNRKRHVRKIVVPLRTLNRTIFRRVFRSDAGRLSPPWGVAFRCLPSDN